MKHQNYVKTIFNLILDFQRGGRKKDLTNNNNSNNNSNSTSTEDYRSQTKAAYSSTTATSTPSIVPKQLFTVWSANSTGKKTHK